MSSPVVTVFSSSDSAAIIMAKLILESEQIRFVAAGEGVQDVIGLGRAPGGFNPITGPVRLQVAAENAERALEALRDLREGGEGG